MRPRMSCIKQSPLPLTRATLAVLPRSQSCSLCWFLAWRSSSVGSCARRGRSREQRIHTPSPSHDFAAEGSRSHPHRAPPAVPAPNRARLRWPCSSFYLCAVIALVIVPFEAIAVPLFYMLDGLRNPYLVQFLPFIASPFSIYLFYSFFAGLPKSLEEAARVDGAGAWRTFFFIMLPNARPVFATVAILQFMASWSSFLWPVMVIDDPTVRPLPLAISVYVGTPPYGWGNIMAFGVMMVLPMLSMFLTFPPCSIPSVLPPGVKR